MFARIHETDALLVLEAEENHDPIVAKDKLVGTGGFEPPTPSVSGKCSTTELRAFVANPGGVISREPDPVTNIRRPGNQGLRERPPAAYLISSAANGSAMDRERIALIFFFGFLALMGYQLYLLLSPFLVPLAWAMLLAFIAHPALLQLDRLIRSRTAAALLITAILALLIAVPTAWLSSKLALEATVSLGQFVHQGGIAQAGSRALHSDMITSMEVWLEQQGLRIEDVRHWMGRASTYLTGYFTANLASLARNLVTFVIGVVIMLFSFFYLLRDGEDYFEFVRALTPLNDEDKTMVFETLSSILSSTMRGVLVTALLEGILLCLGYLVTGVPNALLLGAASGAAGLLPIGGTALVWVPAVIYLWVTSGWGWAVVLLVWGVIVVGVIDNLLKPITIGQGSGIPAVALFFGITGGLEVYGVLGLFAGPAVIAVFAALIRVYRRSYAARPPSSFM
jgi:predicted PurR-regulated permease PerM